MSRVILLFTSVIITAVFTINAYWFQFNGHTTINIINRLPLLFAPASYVYYIWIIIFISLFLWIYNYIKLRGTDFFVTNLQTVLFLIVVILQIASLWAWHYNYLVLSTVILFIQVVTLFGLYYSYPLKKELFSIRMPISIYFSWSTFILILHTCYVLLDYQWSGFGISFALWAVIVMTFGTAIALHLRFHHFDIVYPIIFIWSYIGIAVQNGFDELLVTTAALFLAGVMVVGIFLIKKNPVHLK